MTSYEEEDEVEEDGSGDDDGGGGVSDGDDDVFAFTDEVNITAAQHVRNRERIREERKTHHTVVVVSVPSTIEEAPSGRKEDFV